VVPSWVPDWSWGFPLLVLTVVAHVSTIFWTAKMLGTYRRTAANKASHFVIFVAFAALASAVYLAIEAAAWAALYLWLGALPAWSPAMLAHMRFSTAPLDRRMRISKRNRSSKLGASPVSFLPRLVAFCLEHSKSPHLKRASLARAGAAI
jgi:hypothetical protein